VGIGKTDLPSIQTSTTDRLAIFEASKHQRTKVFNFR